MRSPYTRVVWPTPRPSSLGALPALADDALAALARKRAAPVSSPLMTRPPETLSPGGQRSLRALARSREEDVLDEWLPSVVKAATGFPGVVRPFSGGRYFHDRVRLSWPEGFERFYNLLNDFRAYRFGWARRSRHPYLDTALVGQRFVCTDEASDFDAFVQAVNTGQDGPCYAAVGIDAWGAGSSSKRRAVLFYPREIIT